MNEPLPDDVKRQRKADRASARRKLQRLVREQNHRCAFCNELIVVLSDIPPQKRMHQTAAMVYFWDKYGRNLARKIATVEHVVRIADGGHGRDTTNLKAACFTCNANRNTFYQRSLSNAAYAWCARCGKNFTTHKYCGTCRKALARRKRKEEQQWNQSQDAPPSVEQSPQSQEQQCHCKQAPQA